MFHSDPKYRFIAKNGIHGVPLKKIYVPSLKMVKKWPIFGPLRVPPVRGQIFDFSNLVQIVADIAYLGSVGEISMKNTI